MIRILIFLIVVLLLGAGFAWLADRPGDLVVTFGGYRYEVSLIVAAAAIVAILAVVMILWWLIKGVVNSPYLIARHFRARRRDRGYQALSTGMIAAGAGDAVEARRMNRQAVKLISADQEPLLHLLEAQTMLLEGDHDAARRKFQDMLDDPGLRPLALRGLYLEADRHGQREVARHYAARAAEIAPQLPWAAEATLEARTEEHDWDAALRLVGAQRAVGQIERAAADRKRAVLLTAKAIACIDADPMAARNAAIEANRLEPDFVPAAVTAARALFKQNDLKRGSRILEAAWKRTAHPEIAEAYVYARPGDSTRDRLVRSERLAAMRRNNVESCLAVAREALAVGDYRRAREEAEAAIRIEPREGAYLLRADIEEAETGDQGRVRAWLARAVRARPDPAWVADGYVSDHWEPLSPVTGRLDAFEWRVPVERLGAVVEAELPEPATTPPDPPEPLAIAAGERAEAPNAAAAGEARPAMEAGGAARPRPPEGEPKPARPEEAASAKAGPPESGAGERSAAPAPQPDAERPKPAPPRPAEPIEAEAERKPRNGEAPPQIIESDVRRPSSEPPRLPDDPGVEADETPPAGRFRLF